MQLAWTVSEEMGIAHHAGLAVCQPDIAHARQHLDDRDPDFGAGQPIADAGMRAVAEGQMLGRVLAFHVDHVRIVEMSGIAICRAPLQYYDRSEEHTSELQSLMRNSYAVI